MFDLESGYFGKRNLVPPIPSLGQIADGWNPQRAEAERAAAQKMLVDALQRLVAGESVPLSEFLKETTGKQIDKELAGR